MDQLKRTSSAVQEVFAAPAPTVKKQKKKTLVLPETPEWVQFSFLGRRGRADEAVEQEFLNTWEKVKKDPAKMRSASRNGLIQPREFVLRCHTFFSKGTLNPFEISVEEATNPAMGKGAFITKGAKKGEILGIYPPIVIKHSNRNESPYLFGLDSTPELSDFSLDAEGVDREENFTPFINDIPEETNVVFIPYYTEKGPMIVLEALKDFEPGVKTELSAEYGDKYWDVINKERQRAEPDPDPMEIEEKQPPKRNGKKSAPPQKPIEIPIKEAGEAPIPVVIPASPKSTPPRAVVYGADEAGSIEELNLRYPRKRDPNIFFKSIELLDFMYPSGTEIYIRERKKNGKLSCTVETSTSTPKVHLSILKRKMAQVTHRGRIILGNGLGKATPVHDAFIPIESFRNGLVLARFKPGADQYVLIKVDEDLNATIVGSGNIFYNIRFKPPTFFDLLPLPGIKSVEEAMAKLEECGLTTEITMIQDWDGVTCRIPFYMPYAPDPNPPLSAVSMEEEPATPSVTNPLIPVGNKTSRKSEPKQHRPDPVERLARIRSDCAEEYKRWNERYPLKNDPKIRFQSKELVEYMYPTGTPFKTRTRENDGSLKFKLRGGNRASSLKLAYQQRKIEKVTEEGKILTRNYNAKINPVYDSSLIRRKFGNTIILGRLDPNSNQYALVEVDSNLDGTMPQVYGLPYEMKNIDSPDFSFWDWLPLPRVATIPEAIRVLAHFGLNPKEGTYLYKQKPVKAVVYEPWKRID